MSYSDKRTSLLSYDKNNSSKMFISLDIKCKKCAHILTANVRHGYKCDTGTNTLDYLSMVNTAFRYTTV